MGDQLVRVVLSGFGRMGRRIAALASAADDISIVGALERDDNPDLGEDLGEIAGVGKLGAKIWPASRLKELVSTESPEVLVDFTTAEASVNNVSRAARMGLRVVLGTTGHSEDQMEEILSSIRNAGVPAVISPNMSFGVNVLIEASRLVARMLPNYDVEIVEIHHNQKVDAPSGTALKIARIISEAIGDERTKIVEGRKGMGARQKGEIGIASLRAGDVAGEHTVIFAGRGERLELVHRAQSRDAYASGVLESVRFVSGAKPGIYSVLDVLRGKR